MAAATGGTTKLMNDFDTFFASASSADIAAEKVSINKALNDITSYDEKLYELYDVQLSEEMAKDMVIWRECSKGA